MPYEPDFDPTAKRWYWMCHVTVDASDGTLYNASYTVDELTMEKSRIDNEDIKRGHEMVTVLQCVNSVYKAGKSVVSMKVTWRREWF